MLNNYDDEARNLHVNDGLMGNEVNTVTVTQNADLPRKGDSISYKLADSDIWNKGEVVSRGGKASTASWHFLNIQKEGETEPHCLSLKGAEWKKDDVQDEVLYSEVVFFSADESQRFEAPKLEEIQKWKDMKAIEEVPDTGQGPRVSSRWVLTEKVKGGDLVLKARLVARGFEELDPQVQTDSPTCQKECLRLLLVVLVSHNWHMHSIDIKSAYLQGLDMSRKLYLEPPPEANCAGSIWLLLKCPYGISDAGRLWYMQVVKVLESLGGKQLTMDYAVFVWFRPEGTLLGMIVVHVDDFLFGGAQEFHDTIIKRLKERFIIGLEEKSSMKYLGLMIKETDLGIELNTDKYNRSLCEIDIPNNLGDNSKPLTKTETTSLRKLSGQLNWLASQTRIDLGYDNCIIATSITKATVKDLIYANKVVRKAIGQPAKLNFPKGFDIYSCRIVGFGDAGFANLPDRGSQGAYVILLVDDNGLYCIITWQSKRIRRVVGSTLAAECLAVVATAEAAVHLQTLLKEIFPPLSFPIHIFSDNDSLVQSCHSTTPVEGKRLQIDIAILRDMLKQSDIKELRWVPSGKNLADCLTKLGANMSYLRNVVHGHPLFDMQTAEFR